MVTQSKKLESSEYRFTLECLAELDGSVEEGWVWLTFEELQEPDYKEIKMVWDNSDYLIDNLYPFLERYIERSLNKRDKKEFEDIIKYLDDEKAEELLELLSVAIDLGWF